VAQLLGVFKRYRMRRECESSFHCGEKRVIKRTLKDRTKSGEKKKDYCTCNDLENSHKPGHLCRISERGMGSGLKRGLTKRKSALSLCKVETKGKV